MSLYQDDQIERMFLKFLCHFFFSFFFVLGTGHFKAASAGTYACVIMEASSGKILHEVNANQPVYPASLTKMMTLYLTFQALEQKKLSLNQFLKVSACAQHQAPCKLGLKKGEKITVKNAILGLVTKSANDASVTLAEALGKTETQFAAMMTRTAKKIGLHHTKFQNASGLPNPYQKTTARDMALLAQALCKHYPTHYNYFKAAVFQFRGVAHKNHNRLLGKVHGVDGIKTGFINASGYNLAASVLRNGKRLIVVVMGGKTSKWRDNHITQLINTAYQAPHKLSVVTAGAGIKKNPQRESLNISSLLSQAYAGSSQDKKTASIDTIIKASSTKHISVKSEKHKASGKRKTARASRKSKKIIKRG